MIDSQYDPQSMQTPLFTPTTSASALVVGDIILDRYIHGETSRISPEAPVPVVRVQNSEDRPGGAGNVAQNLCATGVRVKLLGITGDDQAADLLTERLTAIGVACQFSRQLNSPTLTKLRVLSQNQQLLRLDYEEEPHITDSTKLLDAYRHNLGDADIVILSDYAKGSLAKVDEFIKMAKHAGVPVVIDPKGTDFSRYTGANLITPNQKELEAVVGSCGDVDQIIDRAQALRRQLSIDAILLTRGEAGMTLIQKDRQPLHFRARAHEVYDVTGAGDTVIAVLAAALISGYALEQAAEFANIAAGVVVEKLGTATASVDEINRITPAGNKHIRSLALLDEQLGILGRRQRKIVMTNGCFDLLHAGHINYLTAAKQLGDYLLVAVNDDQSVSRLKGRGRPIIPLSQRVEILAALGCVDGVIAFAEDTPEQLIRRVSPAVLVKGGDYTEAQIAGAAHVRNTGGEIKILPLAAGCSTTSIIEKITRCQSTQ